MTGLEDLVIAARTVFGEARGESYAGKKAVAHVLLNRLRAGGAPNLAAVCLRPLQFSCWNRGDPNLPVLTAAGFDDPALRDSFRALLEAFDETDPTQGATHYLTPAAYERMQKAPARNAANWAKDLVPSAAIGTQLFFNNLD